MPETKRLTVVTGHYGCGKTNLALNLAMDSAGRHGRATLVDLDVVNPYFRSSDHAALLAGHDVRVISPTFAGTTLDVPSLSASVYSAFEDSGVVIFDVGGDDAGATALGRFSREIGAIEHDVLYVVNCYRNLTATPSEAALLLEEIEYASHLKATGVVNNSHLRDETTVATVLDSLGYARETAQLVGLPLVCTTVPRRLENAFSDEPGAATYVENAYPVQVWVRTPWEEAP
ncbi:MAG: ParA family protein [Coriobacteriia bacterium]|nr:ParA family protein [Coriobacteriia bacterium]